MIHTMLKINLRTLIMFFMSLIAIESFQAQNTKDTELWTSVGVKYKANKQWSFELSEQLRLDNNSSEISEYFTELITSFSFSKQLKLAVGARFIRENDRKGKKQGYENHARFQTDITYKTSIKRLSVQLRARYQHKNELGKSEAEGDIPKSNVRFKFATEYNFSNWKLDPEFSTEIFYANSKNIENMFNRYRFTVGTSYKIPAFGKIKVFYRYQQQLNVIDPESTSIVGLKYVYTFDRKK